MGLVNWLSNRGKKGSLVGVDIGSSAVKIAALRPNGSSGYQLEALGSYQLPEDSIVDGAIISKLPVAEAIEEIFRTQKIKNSRIATSISGHSVIVKKITLPALSREELDESIQWEAERYIPFDISDVNVDYQIVRESPEGQKLDIILVAAKKEKITDYTSVISMAGKIPVVVDIDAFALQNVYEVNYRPEPKTFAAMLNIGHNVMNIAIVRGSDFLFTRDIAIGGSHYTDFLQKELGVTFADAEKYKKGSEVPAELSDQVTSILDSVSENLALEVEKTFDYFKTTTNSNEIQEIYLSGGASRTAGLREYLAEKFHVPVEFLNPFRRISANGKEPSFELGTSASDYVIAVGLALRTAQDR